MPTEVPFPDPLGILEGEARLSGAPVVPKDPLVLACRHWLSRFIEERERAIQNYARSLMRFGG